MDARRLLIGIVATLGLMLSACRRGEQSSPPPPPVSPRVNPGPEKITIPSGPKPRPRDDWREDAVDAGASSASVAAGATKQTQGEENGDGGVPNDAAEAEARRAALEGEVDAALQGVSASLKACYDRAKVSSSTARVRLTIHRTGRVLSSDVSGVTSAVRSCIAQQLSGLHMRRPLDETTTVERTLKVQAVPR